MSPLSAEDLLTESDGRRIRIWDTARVCKRGSVIPCPSPSKAAPNVAEFGGQNHNTRLYSITTCGTFKPTLKPSFQKSLPSLLKTSRLLLMSVWPAASVVRRFSATRTIFKLVHTPKLL